MSSFKMSANFLCILLVTLYLIVSMVRITVRSHDGGLATDTDGTTPGSVPGQH